jgi:hypothetical protein
LNLNKLSPISTELQRRPAPDNRHRFMRIAMVMRIGKYPIPPVICQAIAPEQRFDPAGRK